MIDQVRGGLRHAPGVARGTDAAPLAGKGDQKVVSTFRTVCAGKPVDQNAAFQVVVKLPFDNE